MRVSGAVGAAPQHCLEHSTPRGTRLKFFYLPSGLLPGDESLRCRVLSLFALFSIQLELKHSDTTRANGPESARNCAVDSVGLPPPRTVTFRSSAPPPPVSNSEEQQQFSQQQQQQHDHRIMTDDSRVEEEGGGGEDYSGQQVQVVQTDSGEILLVTCDPLLQEPDRSVLIT